MTDAAMPVDDQTLRMVAHRFLTDAGIEIEQNEHRWHVTVPAHVKLEAIGEDEFDLVFDAEHQATDGARVLTPESEFGQQLLETISRSEPVSWITLTEAEIDGYQYPTWLQESEITVESTEFEPYYDRQAVCALVRVSVETVSEYETAFLEAVAVDITSDDVLKNLSDTILRTVFDIDGNPSVESTTNRADVGSEPLRVAQKAAVNQVDQKLAHIKRRASQAARDEFQEYRNLREQRLEELRSEIESINKRLERLGGKIDNTSSSADRMELLEERKELHSKREELEAKHEEIRTEQKSGFSGQRAVIYDRHEIEVQSEVVTATGVSYERGELVLAVHDGADNMDLRVPYGIGVGVTEQIKCHSCGSVLEKTISPSIIGDKLCCGSCASD
jgi:hypothetical protein